MHESEIRWLRGGSLTKSEQSFLNDVFFPMFICEKGEEEGQNWENLGKFESIYFLNHLITISSITDKFLKFISRGLIFAICYSQKFCMD